MQNELWNFCPANESSKVIFTELKLTRSNIHTHLFKVSYVNINFHFYVCMYSFLVCIHVLYVCMYACMHVCVVMVL